MAGDMVLQVYLTYHILAKCHLGHVCVWLLSIALYNLIINYSKLQHSSAELCGIRGAQRSETFKLLLVELRSGTLIWPEFIDSFYNVGWLVRCIHV